MIFERVMLLFLLLLLAIRCLIIILLYEILARWPVHVLYILWHDTGLSNTELQVLVECLFISSDRLGIHDFIIGLTGLVVDLVKWGVTMSDDAENDEEIDARGKC